LVGGIGVGVRVGVLDGVLVGGTTVGVRVGVLVGVFVGGIGVGVLVGVRVGVAVGGLEITNVIGVTVCRVSAWVSRDTILLSVVEFRVWANARVLDPTAIVENSSVANMNALVCPGKFVPVAVLNARPPKVIVPVELAVAMTWASLNTLLLDKGTNVFMFVVVFGIIFVSCRMFLLNVITVSTPTIWLFVPGFT
jgi:hypothetical protein